MPGTLQEKRFIIELNSIRSEFDNALNKFAIIGFTYDHLIQIATGSISMVGELCDGDLYWAVHSIFERSGTFKYENLDPDYKKSLELMGCNEVVYNNTRQLVIQTLIEFIEKYRGILAQLGPLGVRAFMYVKTINNGVFELVVTDYV